MQLAVDRAAINRTTPATRLALNATLPLLAQDLSRCCVAAAAELAAFDATTPQGAPARAALERALQAFYAAEAFLPQEVRLASAPVRAYTSAGFFAAVRSFLALFVVLAFLVPLGRFVRVAVWEREAGLVDALRTAGVPRAPLIWAWPCVYAGVFCASALLCAALFGTTVFAGGSVSLLVALFGLFALCCVAWGMVLAAACTRTKTATLGGVLSWCVSAEAWGGRALRCLPSLISFTPFLPPSHPAQAGPRLPLLRRLWRGRGACRQVGRQRLRPHGPRARPRRHVLLWRERSGADVVQRGRASRRLLGLRVPCRPRRRRGALHCARALPARNRAGGA